MMRLFLWLPATIFNVVTALRNRLFDAGVLKEQKFRTPLISVGNLSLGGTGKTPHVELLLRLLKDQYKVATLSRGYRRKTNGFREVAVSSTAEESGDEPLQYKHHFPAIDVFVCESRREGISIIEKRNPDVILLDDAYQHRYVKPSANILITEYHSPFFKDHVYPLGRLREARSGYKRADVIIVSKCPDDLTPKQVEEFKNAIRPSKHQQVFFSGLIYLPLKKINTIDGISFQEYKNYNVLMLSGIANPLSMQQYLEKSFRSVLTIIFPDHHHFTLNDYASIEQKFNNIAGPSIIITTEKDAMRIGDKLNHLPVYILPVEVEIKFSDKKHFEQYIINHVRENKANR